MLEKLNICLEEFTKGDNFDLGEYQFIEDLVEVIMSVPIPMVNNKYRSKLKLTKSFDYSYRFLESIDKRYAEYLQRLWFSKQINPPKDYLLNERDTMLALMIKACRLHFELQLIYTYTKYGVINPFLLYEIFDGKTNFYINQAYEDLENIEKSGQLDYFMLQRNVVGGCLSAHMLARIKANKNRIGEFVELNDNCNLMSFYETLNYLDLDVTEEYRITSECLQQLKREYKEKIKSIF